MAWIKTILLASMLVAAGLTAVEWFAPAAQAQLPVTPVITSVNVILVDNGAPAAPSRATTISVKITYTWSAGGTSPSPTPIHLNVSSAPLWAPNAHLEPATVYALVPGSNTTSTTSSGPFLAGQDRLLATLNFTVVKGAPAFQTGNITVLAEAAANGNLAPSQGTGVLTTRPDFIPALNVTGENETVRGGFWTAVPFHLLNSGNGATKIKVCLSSQPEPSEIQMPNPITLNPRAASDLDVLIRLPWTGSTQGALILSIVGTSAANPLSTNVISTTATVQIQGISAIPGPDATGTGAAVAAAALVLFGLRRR
ncbi:MAG: hypothetical protein ACYDDF_01845 [Thermoplasmatota archaeon]